MPSQHCTNFPDTAQFSFDFTVHNIITEQKGKGLQGIRAIEAFEYENTRSDFKCCNYREK